MTLPGDAPRASTWPAFGPVADARTCRDGTATATAAGSVANPVTGTVRPPPSGSHAGDKIVTEMPYVMNLLVWHVTCNPPDMSKSARLSVVPSALDPDSIDCLLSLPQIANVTAVAFACRVTAQTFLEQGGRWGKEQLGAWLMGPYATLTRLTSIEAPCVAVPTSVPTVLPDLDEPTIRRLIANARLTVTETIADVRHARAGASFSLNMFSKGFVAAFEDGQRAVGWLPTNHASTLTDRVLSLVAADYLTRPEDYRPRQRSSHEPSRHGAFRQRHEDRVDLVLPLPRARAVFARTNEA